MAVKSTDAFRSRFSPPTRLDLDAEKRQMIRAALFEKTLTKANVRPLDAITHSGRTDVFFFFFEGVMDVFREKEKTKGDDSV